MELRPLFLLPQDLNQQQLSDIAIESDEGMTLFPIIFSHLPMHFRVESLLDQSKEACSKFRKRFLFQTLSQIQRHFNHPWHQRCQVRDSTMNVWNLTQVLMRWIQHTPDLTILTLTFSKIFCKILECEITDISLIKTQKLLRQSFLSLFIKIDKDLQPPELMLIGFEFWRKLKNNI